MKTVTLEHVSIEAKAGVQKATGEKNRDKLQAVIAAPGGVTIKCSGNAPLLPVTTDKPVLLIGHGVTLYAPKETDAEALITVNGAPVVMNGVSVFSQPGSGVGSLLSCSRTDTRGSDPGVKLFGGSFVGHTYDALIKLAGAELFESHGCDFSQDGIGDAVRIIEEGSTTRYMFFGGAVKNYGQGVCVRSYGNVRELVMNGTYVTGKGPGVVSSNIGAGTPEVSGWSFRDVRFETAGEGVDVSATWCAETVLDNCFKGTIDGKGSDRALLKVRKSPRNVLVTPTCRHAGGSAALLKQEVSVAVQ